MQPMMTALMILMTGECKLTRSHVDAVKSAMFPADESSVLTTPDGCTAKDLGWFHRGVQADLPCRYRKLSGVLGR